MISKGELKKKWKKARANNANMDLDSIVNYLLDRLEEGSNETLVSENVSTAFLKTIDKLQESPAARRYNQPRIQPGPPLSEGEECMHHNTQSDACSEDESNGDHEEPPPIPIEKPHCTWWSCLIMICRLMFYSGVAVALFLCALHVTELDNKIAAVVMNHPLLAAQWDTLGGKSIRILVTGKTGTGKSALINGLIGQKLAAEGDTLDPETSEVQQIKRMVQGVSMSIFDSPGLQDGTKREYEYMQDMQWKCRSVDLVLYAIRMTDKRVHAEDTKAMKKLTKAFGVEFWNRAIFVLTFANEVQDPADPEDQVKTEAYFKKRLAIWEESLPGIIEERVKIPAEIMRRIPIIPVGYYNIRDLPGQEYWFTHFWLAALNRMKEAGANGAGYMLEFSKDRIKASDQITEQDFDKPIYEQPIVYEE